MSSDFNKFLSVLSNLREQFIPFKVDFMDRNNFKDFAMKLSSKLGTWSNVYVTGYFSEGMREEFERLGTWKRLRLICPEFDPKLRRNRRDLQALRKLSQVTPEREGAGVEIKFSNMLHARLFIAFNRQLQSEEVDGLLVMGSFDFNKEGISGERFDAGIYTRSSDLVKSAIKFFEDVWDDSSSIPLDKAFSK
jgi:hypothetical protein